MLLMRPGDKWRVWLKSELAYGGASKGAASADMSLATSLHPLALLVHVRARFLSPSRTVSAKPLVFCSLYPLYISD